jgi:L-2-hydroxyglutarate oxidase LhgO
VTPDIDTVVIGAGVVGLAVARALAGRGREVFLLEQNRSAGAGVSARSSEVIHAGLYYPPGSLKARLCIAGNRLLYELADQSGVPVRRCGKLLVATEEAELDQLQAIRVNAEASGVRDLVSLSAGEAMALEPELRCLAALLSPSTGVIDSAALLLALEAQAASLGVTIAFNTRVVGMCKVGDGAFKLETLCGAESACITSHNLVIAAGLGSTSLGRLVHNAAGYRVPETYPAKGHYFELAGRTPFRHLVYPLPHGGGLGIHYTLDVGGRARLGPDFEWKDEISYAFEDASGERRRAFESAARRYWPGLPSDVLRPASTGVRPKITNDASRFADFAIHGEAEHGVRGLIGLYGIDSPGLTSCLAIGDHVSRLLA